MGIPRDCAEYQPTAKNLKISPSIKIFLKNVHLPLAQQFLSHHSIEALFVAVVIAAIFFFFFKSRLYMNTHVMLILINQCLLNVVFSITKALTGQISPKYHFYYFHPSILFRKLCFCLSLFSSFLKFLFISNFKIFN